MNELPWSVRGVEPGASIAIERVCCDCGKRFMDSGWANSLCPPCSHKPKHQRAYALTWDGEVEVTDGYGNPVGHGTAVHHDPAERRPTEGEDDG